MSPLTGLSELLVVRSPTACALGYMTGATTVAQHIFWSVKLAPVAAGVRGSDKMGLSTINRDTTPLPYPRQTCPAH